MAEREIVGWFTVNGVHVPIFEGQSKADAIKEKFEPGSSNSGLPFKKGDTPKVIKDDARYKVTRIDSKGRTKDYGYLMGSDVKPMLQLYSFKYEIADGVKDGFWSSQWVKFVYDVQPDEGYSSPSKQDEEFRGKVTEVLGEKNDVDPEKQAYFLMGMRNHVINPEFEKGGLYRTNCALCTTATALQLRGYDVEAMPRDPQWWRGSNSVFDVDYSNPNNYMLPDSAAPLSGVPSVNHNYDHNFEIKSRWFNYQKEGENSFTKVENPPITPRGAKAVAKAVIDKVRSWGNGAVGEVAVLWVDRGSAHSIAVFNYGGNVVMFDSQTGTMRREDEFEYFFKRTSASSTYLVRLDNAPLKVDSATSDATKKMYLDELRKMVKRRK